MNLCDALTHTYGHNRWFNPIRMAGSVPGIFQTPFEAYEDLKPEFQSVVRSLFGGYPGEFDGIFDDSCPVDYVEQAEIYPNTRQAKVIRDSIAAAEAEGE